MNAVAEAYNEGRSENEKLENTDIGIHLSNMGLTRKCRMEKGKMGHYVSENLINQLLRRYEPEKKGEKIERIERIEGYIECNDLSSSPSLSSPIHPQGSSIYSNPSPKEAS